MFTNPLSCCPPLPGFNLQRHPRISACNVPNILYEVWGPVPFASVLFSSLLYPSFPFRSLPFSSLPFCSLPRHFQSTNYIGGFSLRYSPSYLVACLSSTCTVRSSDELDDSSESPCGRVSSRWRRYLPYQPTRGSPSHIGFVDGPEERRNRNPKRLLPPVLPSSNRTGTSTQKKTSAPASGEAPPVKGVGLIWAKGPELRFPGRLVLAMQI